MIFGKTRLEMKVGIFVFIGLIILVIFVLSIGGFKTWTSGYRVNFLFHFVNGTKIGAPVRFAGVDVGEVKEIRFGLPSDSEKTSVHVNCWVKKEICIPCDSTIWVNTLGLLGEKYIEVMPGKDYAHCLTPGQELAGTDPMPMQEVTSLAKKIAEDIDESIVKLKNQEGTVGKLLYNDEIYNELQGMIVDLRKNPWKLFWKTKEKK